MLDGNIILAIQSEYNQFTKAEKKIADYVIKNKQKVLYMSISELAEAVGIGEASISRFCKTCKLEGYQDFKMKLSLSFKGDKTENIVGDDLFSLIIENHISALKNTLQILDKEEVKKVVELIEKSKRIFFFGVGDSLLIAETGRNRFLRITGKVYCVSDPHIQSMVASTMTEEDLLIIISYSGSSKDNIHVAKIAKENKANIVAITHYRKSPLTSLCDYVLISGKEESPLDGGNLASKVAQLFVIDILYREFYQRNLEESILKNKSTSKSVVEKLL